ncbi:hypothetical protein EBE87_20275 [Pseudoroseomonas wenyumeiae]|uniref:Uncharacterized protein n=1 Tax=Teichococcus wenyumeiae TaxID=2478470 RepID=A0A3A9JEY5_9PROT|nr:hypothetical protein [Pseudoroseomonas wenyumeiae]RKK04820.1 hypothetical protein D6Z83_07550 [Pseudoroseomonas wenyumeiae]RMI19488.1 hypothetical protein EBE87_20275 [Pseudoroseomonas wenyumeiae]
MPDSGRSEADRIRDLETLVARLSERTHAQANQRQVELSTQFSAQARAPKTPSMTAIIAMVGSALGIIIGCITIGSNVFNMGGSVKEMQVMQTNLASSIAEIRAGLQSGREQREKDVNRLEGLIRQLDAEQRTQGTRLTRQEVLQGIMPPRAQQQGDIPSVSGGSLPPAQIQSVRQDLLGRG